MQEQTNEEITKVTRPNRQLPLDEWLERMNSVTLWSKSIRHDLCVEAYRIGNGIAIVLRYDRGGWDIFTSGNMIMIPSTLRDAERRLGVAMPEPPDDVQIEVVHDAHGPRVELDLMSETIGLTAEVAEVIGLALVAAADSARDPRRVSDGSLVK